MELNILIFAFSVLGLACSAPNGLNPNPHIRTRRLVGGSPAVKGEWPWMAAVLGDDKESRCGGALISDRHILTAANCFIDIDNLELTIRLGEHDFLTRESSEKDFKIFSVKMHEQYSRTTQANDIALVTLSESVKFSPSIMKISLPDKNMVIEGENAYVTGWGTTCIGCDSSKTLLKVSMPVWKQSDCVDAFSKFEMAIPSTQVCAGFKEGKKDACNGDSGGPLMMKDQKGRWTLVGIVSYGRGCAQPNSPGVYTRVSSYIDWIKTNSV